MDMNVNECGGSSVFEAREIDILVFNVGEYRLGISLGKVREITRMPVIKSVPYSHPAVRGLFELRNQLIPALDLRVWLGAGGECPGTGRAIISRFMGLTAGFLVDGVERIHRINWRDIEPPDTIKRFSDDILGTVKLEGGLINMIDYERVVLDINPDVILPQSPVRKDSKKLVERRGGASIWIVEDSRIVRDFLKHLLTEKGYTDIIFFENGRHALETLSIIKKQRNGKRGQYGETGRVDMIITDIEMPVMDGYTFIGKVKADEVLRDIPIIIYSSLFAAGDKLKGEVVAADAQLCKSDSTNLVRLIDRFIFK
jgi:two-component system chemotaxis response regulator CheV